MKATVATFCTFVAIASSTVQASSMIGKPLSMIGSNYCKLMDCGQVGKQRITSEVVNDMFAMDFHRLKPDKYPDYGLIFDVFSKNNTVISARIHVYVQDDLFYPESGNVKGSMNYIGSEFVRAMTGMLPNASILASWQKSCNSQEKSPSKYVAFARYRLTCDYSSERVDLNSAHLTLMVLK